MITKFLISWCLSALILFASAAGARADTVYAWTNFAGQPGIYGSMDGTGNAARFYYPMGVAVDGSGNVFVADQGAHTIRKVTPASVVTTLAGKA